MRSPEEYRRENELKTIEELVMERLRLYNEIADYENEHIIDNVKIEDTIKPSPKDIYNMNNLYLNEITNLIVTKNQKADLKSFMYKLSDNPPTESNDDLEEFKKYSKLYEERFGKKAYIAEPSGTIEQTIDAIKTCLEKNEDILDELLYPNMKKDLDNGVLYTEKELTGNVSNQLEFYKKNDSDTIWWVENPDKIGEHLFTFDKSRIYNLFKDYPYKLSNEEKEIFDKENPYWADFFKDRIKNENNNPNCIFCGEPTVITFVKDSNGGHEALVCSKCNKYQYPKELEETINKDINNIIDNSIVSNEKTEKVNLNNIPTCPNCSGKLTFMMPDGKTLYCDNCKKYYVNNNGVAGEETGSPYTRTDVLY